MTSPPLVIERSYKAPVEKVWSAITSKDAMKKWYFDLREFKAEPGFAFEFLGGTDRKKYLHLCTVTEVISGRKLTYSWRYDGYAGMTHVSFELFAEGESTRLKLTHAGLETLPQDNPDFARENFAEGWTQIAGTALKEFVEAGNA